MSSMSVFDSLSAEMQALVNKVREEDDRAVQIEAARMIEEIGERLQRALAMNKLHEQLNQAQQAHIDKLVQDGAKAASPSPGPTSSEQKTNMGDQQDQSSVNSRPATWRPKIPFKGPKVFTGSAAAGESRGDVRAEYEAFKVKLDAYISNEMSFNIGKLDHDQHVRFALQYLDGEALHAARAVERTHARLRPEVPFTWSCIVAELDQMFGAHTNPHVLLAAIREVKQREGEDVESYTARFQRDHRPIIAAGLTNKITSTEWYTTGLATEVQIALTKRLRMRDVLDGVDLLDAAGAIVRLAVDAAAIEDALRSERRAKLAARAATETQQVSSKGWKLNNHFAKNHWKTSKAPSSGAIGQLNMSLAGSYAKKLGIAENTVQQRFDAKQCLACGAMDHRIRECPKIRGVPRINALEADGGDEITNGHREKTN